MEIFEYILIVLACVIISSVLGKFVHHLALPLIQILVGFLAAIILPSQMGIQVSSELFLVLFIAPLLFNEARESRRRVLWANKGAIFSLAVGLVLVTVLALGFVLNLIVPTIPLAAAFACAAALGPTDAAAVSALGSTVSLRPRQRTLLSGESLVNDASGVVAFQFAIAAVLTGTFSVVDAGESFAVLFFGGILLGLAMGAMALGTMKLLQHFGYEDTTLHALYEVFTPFMVFLIAEWIGVSGILAVVAAGLVMSDNQPHLVSADAAKRKVVSDNFWKVIVYLINGVIFVMLGMQLPTAIAPEISSAYSLEMLLAIVGLCSAVLFICRFLWIGVMQLIHRDRIDGTRGIHRARHALHSALVMTLAGPKGAVTLSMIFTIPFLVNSGEVFPERQLLIFVAAGVILVTLLAANFLLPLLAPQELKSDEGAVRDATIEVLEETVQELRRRLDSDGPTSEYTPAMRLALARYQTRLTRERAQVESCGTAMKELSQEILALQQQRADELQGSDYSHLSEAEFVPYFATLRSIRASVGYHGPSQTIGSRFHSLRGRLRLALNRLLHGSEEQERSEQVYYDTCLFAIELERVTIDYLRKVIEADDGRKRAAEVVLDTHQAAMNSLWGRINYGRRGAKWDTAALQLRVHDELPEGMEGAFVDQFAKARRYANEVDAAALSMELDSIRHLLEQGRITNDVARELRQRVYAMQLNLEG